MPTPQGSTATMGSSPVPAKNISGLPAADMCRDQRGRMRFGVCASLGGQGLVTAVAAKSPIINQFCISRCMGKAHLGVQLLEEYWVLLPLLEVMETHTSFAAQDSRAVSGSQPIRSPWSLSHPQAASEVARSVEHQPPGLCGGHHPALLLCGHQRLQLLLLNTIRAAVTLRPATLRDVAGELEAGALLRHCLVGRLGLLF